MLCPFSLRTSFSKGSNPRHPDTHVLRLWWSYAGRCPQRSCGSRRSS
jgi:hypothetical protein